jgi:hypothetical protein
MCRVDVIKECPNSAPPPWHSVAILVGFVTCFVYYLPSFESIDEDATAANFSNVLFKSVLDLRTLACIRLVIASSIWATSLHTVLGEGWVQDTAYLKGSKLKRVSNRLRGVSTMFPFTSVSWNLLGAAFTCSGMIALKMDRQEPLHPYLLRAALILWEISGPTTLLVAAVIVSDPNNLFGRERFNFLTCCFTCAYSVALLFVFTALCDLAGRSKERWGYEQPKMLSKFHDAQHECRVCTHRSCFARRTPRSMEALCHGAVGWVRVHCFQLVYAEAMEYTRKWATVYILFLRHDAAKDAFDGIDYAFVCTYGLL